MSIATYLNNKKLAMSDIMLVSLGKAEGFYHKLRVIYFFKIAPFLVFKLSPDIKVPLKKNLQNIKLFNQRGM